MLNGYGQFTETVQEVQATEDDATYTQQLQTQTVNQLKQLKQLCNKAGKVYNSRATKNDLILLLCD